MYYLGVDVGGTNIAVGIVDENNAIIAKASHPTPVPCSEDAFCDAILAVCNDALAKAGLTLDDVPWIGIGCPGTVNRATGIIEFANNLYFKNFKLRDMMAERTNGKLVILDYKTDKTKDDNELINRHRLQLETYSRALEKALGIPVKEAYIYAFSLDREIKVL